MRRIGEVDLKHVLMHIHKDIWTSIKGKYIFITGATGFFGKWLLETFVYINNEMALNAKVFALSRDPDKFLADFPFYRDEPNIIFIKGDVQNFGFPKEKFHFIIYAANDADVKINIENPLLMLDTITVGTRHVLNFANQQKNLEAILLTRSGAVYGNQPVNVKNTKETDSFFIDLNDSRSAYAEGKRQAELYCAIYNKQFGIPVKIARCFAFVGPYLPLDKHFAIGNFIINSLKNEHILIKGDGTIYRSYLYAADLCIWLWKILFKGQSCRPYNVGSNEYYTLLDIAKKISSLNNYSIPIKILNNNNPFKSYSYVPSIERSKNELGLDIYTSLDLAIKKTILFNAKNI